jgi:hypothetical protein
LFRSKINTFGIAVRDKQWCASSIIQYRRIKYIVLKIVDANLCGIAQANHVELTRFDPTRVEQFYKNTVEM